MYGIKMIRLVFNELSRLKGSKNRKNQESTFYSIYHLTRLSELIMNIYGFDMFVLNLNELLAVKINRDFYISKSYSLSFFELLRI